MISDIDVSVPLAARIPEEGVRTIRARAPAPLPQQAGVMSPPPRFSRSPRSGSVLAPAQTDRLCCALRSFLHDDSPACRALPHYRYGSPLFPHTFRATTPPSPPPLYISAWPAPTPPPARRPAIPHIPLEIMDHILRNLRVHWVKDLASCALVCRSWREFTRPHLFYEISFAFEVSSVIDFITCTGSAYCTST